LVLGDFYEAHGTHMLACAVGLSAVKKNGVGKKIFQFRVFLTGS